MRKYMGMMAICAALTLAACASLLGGRVDPDRTPCQRAGDNAIDAQYGYDVSLRQRDPRVIQAAATARDVARAREGAACQPGSPESLLPRGVGE